MTIEDKLKDLILTKYKSLRSFALAIDIPYSTLNTMLKRGLKGASVSNVSKVCNALGISVDRVAEDMIDSATQRDSKQYIQHLEQFHDEMVDENQRSLNRASALEIENQRLRMQLRATRVQQEQLLHKDLEYVRYYCNFCKKEMVGYDSGFHGAGVHICEDCATRFRNDKREKNTSKRLSCSFCGTKQRNEYPLHDQLELMLYDGPVFSICHHCVKDAKNHFKERNRHYDTNRD